MIGLIRAELLKIRRRQATLVLLVVQIVLMALIFLVTGGVYKIFEIIEFPGAYAIFRETIFAVGGLLAIVFAAAYVGADWNWGVLRAIIARGESRERYLLAKFLAMAITLAVATLLFFALGFVFTYLQGLIYDIPVASPLRGDGLIHLGVWLVFGYLVLLQRAAIGFAVAAVVRSQVAGAVVGIVLFLVETTVTAILAVLSLPQTLLDQINGTVQTHGPEWFQFLPINIGNQVFNSLPGSGGVTDAASSGDVTSLLLRSVPFEIALPVVFIYLVAALALAAFTLRRQQIA